eukprot:6214208-Pleurochrysis_carterae.AAC.5
MQNDDELLDDMLDEQGVMPACMPTGNDLVELGQLLRWAAGAPALCVSLLASIYALLQLAYEASGSFAEGALGTACTSANQPQYYAVFTLSASATYYLLSVPTVASSGLQQLLSWLSAAILLLRIRPLVGCLWSYHALVMGGSVFFAARCLADLQNALSSAFGVKRSHTSPPAWRTRWLRRICCFSLLSHILFSIGAANGTILKPLDATFMLILGLCTCVALSGAAERAPVQVVGDGAKDE